MVWGIESLRVWDSVVFPTAGSRWRHHVISILRGEPVPDDAPLEGSRLDRPRALPHPIRAVRPIRLVQAELGLAGMFVPTVTVEAAVGEQRAHVTVEANALRVVAVMEERRGTDTLRNERHREQKQEDPPVQSSTAPRSRRLSAETGVGSVGRRVIGGSRTS